MKFIIARNSEELGTYNRDEVLFVDGYLEGYNFYDHHITGEKINLDAIPPLLKVLPKVVATNQIDTDSICSAVVVFFGGENNISEYYRGILRTASTYCDYLISNENFDEKTNNKGLGLHFYMKKKGFNMLKRFDPVTSKERSIVFTKLSREVIEHIEKGKELPNDTSYLDRLNFHIKMAKESIIHNDRLVTVISSYDFIDPIASYKVVDTPLLVLQSYISNDLYKYSIGVNPIYYDRYNITNLLTYINKHYEEGWGGRSVAGGSPYSGSSIELKRLIKLIHKVEPLLLLNKVKKSVTKSRTKLDF